MDDTHTIALIAHDALKSSGTQPTPDAIDAAVDYAKDVVAAAKGRPRSRRKRTKRARKKKR